MDLTLEIHELSNRLDDNRKRLLIELIKHFLYNDDVEENDLLLIEQAEREYMRGETISHNDRKWKA